MFELSCHTAWLFDIKRTHSSWRLNVFESGKSMSIELHILNLSKDSITYAEDFFHIFSNLFRKNFFGKGEFALKNAKNSSARYRFTAYITLKDGTRIYAKDRGIKAFCIPVK